MTHIPIRRVRSDGTIDRIGAYDPGRRWLSLERAGFPLLAHGEHDAGKGLPWVFTEAAPSGFIGRRFAGWFPELRLPAEPEQWTLEHRLAAPCNSGHDLPGNLIIGDESHRKFERIFSAGSEPGPQRDVGRTQYHHFVDDILSDDPGGSSVGGQRPKFSLRQCDHTSLLVKFTPPLKTEAGARWADLLRMEHHAAEALRAAGIPSVKSTFVTIGDRGFLEVERYDRLAGGGRVGAVTFYGPGIVFLGEAGVNAAPLVADELVRRAALTADEAALVRRVHDFSGAIGNTDAHTGNYGLVIDDAGRSSLAPFFDINPMAFAPRHDELPDLRVREFAAPRLDNRALVDDLRARAHADPEISRGFLSTWASRFPAR